MAYIYDSSKKKFVDLKNYSSRDSQIREAVLKGNTKRAQQLTRRGIAKSYSRNNGQENAEEGNYSERHIRALREAQYASTLAYSRISGPPLGYDTQRQATAAKEYSLRAARLCRKAGDFDSAIKMYSYAIDAFSQEGKGSKSEVNKMYKELAEVEASKARLETIRERSNPRRDLSSRLTPALVFLSLVGSIFFLSNNVTGNAIAGYNSSTANTSGIILLILAIIFGVVWLSRRKKNKIISSSVKKVSKKMAKRKN